MKHSIHSLNNFRLKHNFRMNFDEKKYIESINFDWDLEYFPSGYNSKSINEIPSNLATSYIKGLNFYSYFIPEYWKYFDLIDVISIASLFKQAFYTAYYENIADFRYFCDKVWKMGTLDFTCFKYLSENQFNNIQNIFFAEKQIFSSNMPKSILADINHRAKQLIFDLHDLTSLDRPNFPILSVQKLTLKGNSGWRSLNQFVDIVCTYSNATSLILHDMIFDETFVSILRILWLREITITSSKVFPSVGFELGRVLFKSRHWLEHIKIYALNDSFNQTCEFILKNIHLFTILKTLHLDLNLTDANIVNLLKIKKSKSLKLLTIHQNLSKIGIEKCQDIEDSLISKNLKVMIIPSRGSTEQKIFD